jgi:hypothetical protein
VVVLLSWYSNIDVIKLGRCYRLNYRLPTIIGIFPSGLVCFRLTDYVPFVSVSTIPVFCFRPTKKCESENRKVVFLTIPICFHPYALVDLSQPLSPILDGYENC